MLPFSAAFGFLLLPLGVSSSPTELSRAQPRAVATPNIDSEVAPAMAAWPLPAILTEELLPTVNQQLDLQYTAEAALANQPFTHKEFNFTTYDGHGSTLSIFIPDSVKNSTSRPFIYYIHGGGLVYGNRFFGIDFFFPTVEALGAVFISVEYRLAPDNPAPAAAEDVYSGLVWAVSHAKLLGIDASNGVVWGSSAGGGLTGAVGLMVRDRKPAGVNLKGLLMQYPMLDNAIPEEERNLFGGESSRVWSSESDKMAWKAYLGSSDENAQNPYLVPARATDLSDLPPIFIDVGSAELFRKPVMTFAQGIWEAGGLVELHVSAGAYHASDILVPTAKVTVRVVNAREDWLADILSV